MQAAQGPEPTGGSFSLKHLQVHLNKLVMNVVEKLIYFSNSTQIVKLVY